MSIKDALMVFQAMPQALLADPLLLRIQLISGLARTLGGRPGTPGNG